MWASAADLAGTREVPAIPFDEPRWTELVGQEEARAALAAVVDGVRGGSSGVLALCGAAGLGKTALLEHAARSAPDLLLVRLVGLEQERELGFAGLHRLMAPLLPRLELLPAPQRQALATALGLAHGGAPDLFLVGLAILTVLTDLAARRPVLILVDDLQWLDRETVRVLTFVGRRLGPGPLGLLVGARSSPDVAPHLNGIPQLWLDGLSAAESAQLLDRLVPGGGLDAGTADRIVAEAQGNPLALVEMARALDRGAVSFTTALVEPLPIGHRLTAHFLEQVHALPAETRSLLLVVATESSGEPELVAHVAEAMGTGLDAVGPAEAAGLVTVTPRLAFRHPLIRSAIYGAAAPDERRRVHATLAALLDQPRDADRRALHLAAAAVGPDEGVAAELEAAANAAAAHGGHASAAEFLVRAAHLTPGPTDQARRLLAAARAALLGGAPRTALPLLDQAEPRLIDPRQRAVAHQVRGQALMRSGDLAPVPALHLAAADAFAGVDDRLAHASLLDALDALFLARHLTSGTTARAMGRQVALAAATHEAGCRDGRALHRAEHLLVQGVSRLLGGDYVEAAPLLKDAVAALGSDEPLDEAPRWFMLGVFVADVLWDEQARLAWLDRVIQVARDRGELWVLGSALTARAGVGHATAGRLAEAEAAVAAARDTWTAVGARELRSADCVADAALLAWQGRETEAREAVADARTIALARGSGSCAATAQLALVVLDLSVGRYEEALGRALPLCEPDQVVFSNRALSEAVEAAVRCGQPDAAAGAARLLEERASASGTDWALGLLARCRALLAAPDEAEESYRTAVELLDRTGVVVEQARARLLYGEWLRRRKRRADAREQLRAAHAAFTAVGTAGFGERATRELSTLGDQLPEVSAASNQELTVRERQIAVLAATPGTTNASIAEQLVLSVSTVEYHLTNVFRKLGVRSRRDLRDML